MTWQRRAACIGKLHLFFPGEGRKAVKALQLAAELCRTCPVLAECRADDENSDEPVGQIYGFRGGRKEDERRDMARKRGRAMKGNVRAHQRTHAEILRLSAQGIPVPTIAELVGVTERTAYRCRGGYCDWATRKETAA